MAEKKTAAAEQDLVEITVGIDGHTHDGEPVEKGKKIKVPPSAAKMLEAAWKKAVSK